MLLSVKLTFGQLHEDFADGDFTHQPPWQGDVSFFYINSQKQLQTSLSSVAQTVMLATNQSLAMNVTWEFELRLNFDPSTSNLARIYLISDQPVLTGALNGYFIQIGETGTADSYDLYRQTGTQITRIIDGPSKMRMNANVLTARIKVNRSELGAWELWTAADGVEEWTLEGETVDATHRSSLWFGVYCRYTNTRSNGFIFNRFEVKEWKEDLTPPDLVSFFFRDAFTAEVQFSKALDLLEALNPSTYLINHQPPEQVEMELDASRFLLRFTQAFRSGTHHLQVKAHIRDEKGNHPEENLRASYWYIFPYEAMPGEVVINEIFADPTPSRGLPAIEFVEVWNRSAEYILLDGWTYADLTTTYTFRKDTLAPGEYLVLCPVSGVSSYAVYGKVKGLSPWPSLNNEGDQLELRNAKGTIIDHVRYTDAWYKDSQKKAGGYSLELIHPDRKCQGIQNWMASVDVTGGSPGRQNSVYREKETGDLELIAFEVLDSKKIRVRFNREINADVGKDIRLFSTDEGRFFPSKASPEEPFFQSVLLDYENAFERNATHRIRVGALSDCDGKLLVEDTFKVTWFVPAPILVGDLLISEVLFHPKAGGVDFVEIYHQGPYVLDLNELYLANADAAGKPANRRLVSSRKHLIAPGTYVVLTTSERQVRAHYHSPAKAIYVELASLPSYPNERGTVMLLSEEREVDRLDYLRQMHDPLLRQWEGVSLERVSFQRATNAVGNFRSASSIRGYATPGDENSQREQSGMNKMWLSHSRFSPDGDGFEDELSVAYAFERPGVIGSVSIYTERGALVRKLITNRLLGTSGTISWDGLDARGQMSPHGIYVVAMEVFTSDGWQFQQKATLVLARPLQ